MYITGIKVPQQQVRFILEGENAMIQLRYKIAPS